MHEIQTRDFLSLDEAIRDMEDEERRIAERDEPRPSVNPRNAVGSVERFYDKIGVAAISLTARVSVGDYVEIDGDGNEIVGIVVSSMQINGNDVRSASAGQSVGIKVPSRVKQGGSVYLVERIRE